MCGEGKGGESAIEKDERKKDDREKKEEAAAVERAEERKKDDIKKELKREELNLRSQGGGACLRATLFTQTAERCEIDCNLLHFSYSAKTIANALAHACYITCRFQIYVSC